MTLPAPVVYVARADQALTVLHLAEPGVFGMPVAFDALTCCGLIMAAGELWVPVDRHPGDRVCGDCVTALGGLVAALLDDVRGEERGDGPAQLELHPGR